MSARRRRLGVAVLVLGLLALVLPAFADTPQTGADPTVTLTVSPSTGLSDGQVVTVTGTGFPPNTVGTIRQCGGSVTAPQCDISAITPFVTTAAGTIPPTGVAVNRIVNTGATTFNCGVESCALVATAGAKSSQHSVRMAGAGTVLTTSSTTTTSTHPATSTSTTGQPTTSTMAATTTSTTGSATTTSTTGSATTTSSSSTTSTVPGATTSTSSTSSTVPSTSCERLRAAQAEANAALDRLAAGFPAYAGVAAQARQTTNAKFVQILALAGC